MNLQNLLKPYKKKIVLEAVIRAIAVGLLAGLVATLICALAFGGSGIGVKAFYTYVDFQELPDWVSLAIGIANVVASLAIGILVGIISGVAMYLVSYKKGNKQIVSN